YGFAMGPFAVYDLAGLEITARRRKAQAHDSSVRQVELWEQLYDLGRLGRKSGAGWYSYANGKRAVDPFVTGLIEAHSVRKGYA
ncbi:3-hydroxyacyl-CoA dehydrogenase family protein, partial [Microbacteriaceae bacterium K1510]|nr:3-hydroxyacyl-CoA dehydrogenase family protein [Microbacteriaceae bacterium K1510]